MDDPACHYITRTGSLQNGPLGDYWQTQQGREVHFAILIAVGDPDYGPGLIGFAHVFYLLGCFTFWNSSVKCALGIAHRESLCGTDNALSSPFHTVTVVLAKLPTRVLGKTLSSAMGSSSPSMGRMAPVNQEAVRERSTCGNAVVAMRDDPPLLDRFAVARNQRQTQWAASGIHWALNEKG